MKRLSFLGLVVGLVIAVWAAPSELRSAKPVQYVRVAAFNVRTFGRKLMNRTEAVSHLLNIFERYDVVLVQEVRDRTQTAIEEFKNKLNARGGAWKYVASERIGRTRYKEQYVYFYRDCVTLGKSYKVSDEKDDVYEREPFVAEFRFTSVSNLTAERRVILLGFHSRPVDTDTELVHLPLTIKSVAAQFPRALGVVALGDMNADCSYLNETMRSSIDLFNSTEFRSLIPHSADTTVSNTDCAYDRVVVYGRDVDARDADVFDFQTAFNLSQAQAFDVSDHFPVEVSLY